MVTARDLAGNESREAARRNAAEEARKAQAYLLAQIATQQAALEQTAAHRGEEAKIERMEEAEGAVLAAAKAAKPQRGEQAYQDYRAGERDAEVIAADYQARKAVQEYRQGERAEVATPVVTPEPKKPWWQRVGDWVAPKVSYAVDAIVAAKLSWDLRHLKFKPLPSGNVSVSASGLPRGMRADYFKDVVNPDFNFRPGPYKPSTVGSIVKNGLIKSAMSSLPTAAGLSLLVNTYEYGKDATSLDDFSDKTLENREFWVSTAVDTAISVAIGAVAAVAAVAILGATAPVWGTVLLAAGIATGAGVLLDAAGLPKFIKDSVNAGLEELGS